MLGAMEVDLASGTNTFSSSDILAVKEAEPYSQMFEFERNFDRWAVEAWVSHNWAWLCLVIGLSYVLLVFLGDACCHYFFLKISIVKKSQEKLRWTVARDSNCDFLLLSGVHLLPYLVRWNSF